MTTFQHHHIFSHPSVHTHKIFTEEEEDEDESTRMFNRVCEAHAYLHDGDVWPVNASQFIIAAGPESGI